MIGALRAYLARPGIGPQLVKAVVGSAGLRLLGMGLGFLVGVQLARGLGPAGYGAYGTAMAIISVLMVPTELGLPQLVTREVAAALASDGDGATTAIVRWARRVVALSSLAIASIAFLALLCGLTSVGHDERVALTFGLLWIPIVAIGNIYGAALRGMRKVLSGQVGEIFARPAIVSLLLWVVVRKSPSTLDPATAMCINVVSALIGAALSVMLLRRFSRRAAPLTQAVPADLRFVQALPIAMTEGMRVLAGQVSILVLAALASRSDVGLYRVASGVYIASTMPSALINAACSPTISRLFTQGKSRELARLNIWCSAFLCLAAVAFVCFQLLYGKAAVSLLFGAAYVDAAALLLIFLVGEAIASLFGHPSVVLNMMRRPAVVMWWSAAGLLANAAATWLLVPRLGSSGAAFGTAAGLVTWRAGCAIYAKRRLGMDTGLVTTLITAEVGSAA